MKDLLVRGLFAGLVAGLLAFSVAKVLGEPPINRAIAVETQLEQQEHKLPDPELVSRDVQSTAGLATGVILVSISLGGVVALAFAFAYGRIGRLGPRITVLVVAGAGFVAVYLVPFLKYPANPPSVGDPSTLTHRTQIYFGLVLLSLLTMVSAFMLGRRLTPRFGAWNATLLASAAFIVVTAGLYVVMPGLDEVPVAFPATTLWHFRIAALGIQATIWLTIGLLFGALIEHSSANQYRKILHEVPY